MMLGNQDGLLLDVGSRGFRPLLMWSAGIVEKSRATRLPFVRVAMS